MWIALLAVAFAAEPTCPPQPPPRSPSGFRVERNEYGDVVARGRLRHGVPDGTWCRWEPYGRLIEEETLVAGVREGPYFSWGAYEARVVGAYAGGQPDGEWSEYDPMGALVDHGTYDHGVRTGTWSEPGPREVSYRDGVLHGVLREWDANGLLVREETYVDGEIDGPVHTFRDGIDRRGEIHHGLRQGEWTVTDPQGVREHGVYVDDLRHGPWRIRELTSIVDSTWDHGVQDGPFQVWSLTGQLQSDGSYRQGKPDGTWTGYAYGLPANRMTYANGVLEGPYSVWESNGDILEEGAFHEGLRSGPWQIRNGEGLWKGDYDQGAKNGPWRLEAEGGWGQEVTWDHDRKEGVERRWAGTVLISECNWSLGVQDGTCATWRYDGTREMETTWKAGVQDGPVRTWHENGKPAEEGMVVLGMMDGPWRQWDEDGKVVAEGSYARGTAVGPWVFRHPSGQIERQGTYSDTGLETGPWVERYVDGTLASRGSYAEGVRTGTWTWWYPSGQVQRRGAYDDYGRTGEWTYWYPNGVVQKGGLYIQGYRNGRWTFRLTTGRVCADVDFAMGREVQVEPRAGLTGDYDPFPDEEDRVQPEKWYPDPPLENDLLPGLRVEYRAL